MPIVTPRSKGLRKFTPQPDRYAERYGHFTLTARDVEILETIYRYRYLEARHVRALVGGSGQQITRRLQGLFHNGYLGRYARRERMRLELNQGAPLIAYGLELKGARALEQLRARRHGADDSAADPVRWKKAYTRRTEWFLEHQLVVSNFRCAIELALRRTPDSELVSWQQGQDTWFRVTVPGEMRRVVRIAPDAYFVLRQGNQVRHFFLEADRSTEEHRRLADKYVGYWWYLQDARFASARGGQPRVNVLLLTTGEERLVNMIETLRQMSKPNRADHGGKGSFRFCLDRDVAFEDPIWIFQPVWRTAAESIGDRRLPLLAPPLHHG